MNCEKRTYGLRKMKEWEYGTLRDADLDQDAKEGDNLALPQRCLAS